MDSIEKSAKTAEEAIQEALRELGCERDQADIEILEAGSRGVFGIGSRPARVLVTKRFDPERIAKDFLRQIGAAMGLSLQIETSFQEKLLSVNITGEKLGILIGKRGQTLDSLQYLVNLVVNKAGAPYINVILDTENYRQRRKETLEALAFNLAKKAKATRRAVVLEPMNPYERRIIHAALQNDKFVTTASEGEEPFRNVVITPKRQERRYEQERRYDK